MSRLAQKLRKTMTEAERKLWQSLRLRQMHGHKFRRQHPIGNYIVDFVCLEAKLIIELDGGQHNLEQNIAADAVRTTFLERHGFQVLRIWNNEIFSNLNGVLEVVELELNKYIPQPGLPPERWKGRSSRARGKYRGLKD